jgi:hypothetical protein
LSANQPMAGYADDSHQHESRAEQESGKKVK